MGNSSPGADGLARIALDLFADRHYSSVSIRDIGRAAEVNSSMIYYYYEDKSDLFRAAIESAVDEAFDLFSHHNGGKYENEVEAINAWFDIHVALNRSLRNVIKISLDCKGVVEAVPDHQNPIKHFYRHESQILQDLIKKGIENGTFRRVDPPLVATMISTILDGVLARSLFIKDFDMIGTVEEFKKAILTYLACEIDEKSVLRHETL